MNRGDVFDSRDSAIKLFGKTISAPESRAPLTAAPKPDVGFQILGKSQALDISSDIAKAEPKDARLEDHGNQAYSSVAVEGEGDKVLRKPDKIIPCPRCNSMDTKFCYFNNYNVNQPRHYCKNCQRYWTAGGTMRNVPVGAGRRKNKQFPSQYGHISASAPSEPQEVLDPANLRSPSVESHSALDGKMQELGREKREETSSCVSSVTSGTQWYRVPLSVAPSVQVWNGNVSANPVQWCTPQLLSVHGFSPNIPSQFVPVSYFGSLPYWSNGAAQKLMAVSDDHRSPTSSTSNACSRSKSPTLGKRSMGGEDTSEKCVSVSKIPRVDDSDKDLKNSFLGTLGFKHNQNERNFQGSMFIPFKSTADCKELASDKSEVLEANPAALSRSHTFQEST